MTISTDLLEIRFHAICHCMSNNFIQTSKKKKGKKSNKKQKNKKRLFKTANKNKINQLTSATKESSNYCGKM